MPYSDVALIDAHRDAEKVNHLRNVLRMNGISVYEVHGADLDSFREGLYRAYSSCKVLLYIGSTAAVRSRFVESDLRPWAEISVRENRDPILLHLRLEPNPPHTDIEQP
jgi:hypothetical protein